MKSIEFTEIKDLQNLKMEDYQCVKEDGQWNLILARGECRTGGYDIKLKEVILEDTVLKAVVMFKDPDPKGFVTMVITYPTRKYLVNLNQEIKEIVFQRENGNILKVIHI